MFGVAHGFGVEILCKQLPLATLASVGGLGLYQDSKPQTLKLYSVLNSKMKIIHPLLCPAVDNFKLRSAHFPSEPG